ncbi:hypothetical protein SPFM10_00161 [Salmonella phage SPFM10]|nr:hypothetical protein SPFM10_00161 [Salmonella phage SPFM10]
MYTSYPSGWDIYRDLAIPDHTTASLDITFGEAMRAIGLYLLYKEHGAGHAWSPWANPTTDNGQAFGFYTMKEMGDNFTVTDIPGKAINGAYAAMAGCTVDGLDRIMDMGPVWVENDFTAHMCALWIAGSGFLDRFDNHTPNEFPTAPNKGKEVPPELVVYVENWAKWLVGYQPRAYNAAARCWYELVVRTYGPADTWTTFHWGDGHPWAQLGELGPGCAAYIWNRWDNYKVWLLNQIRFMHDSQTNYQAMPYPGYQYPFMYTIHTDDRYTIPFSNIYTEGTYQLGAWHGKVGDCTIKDYRLDSLAYCPGDDGWTLTFRIVIRGGSAFTGVENAHFSWYCVNDVPPLFNGKPAAPNYTTIDQVTILPDSARPEDATLSGYQPDHDTDVEPKWRWWWMLPATNGEWKQVIIPQSIVYRADADFNFRFEDTDPNDDAGFIIGFWLTDAGVAPEKFENNIYDGRSGTIVEALFEDYIIADARACSDYGGCTWQVEQHDIDLGHLARMTNPANGADTEEVNWYGCTLPGSTSMEVCDNGDALACKVMVDINPVKQQAVRFRINSQSKLRVTYGGRDENGDIVFRSEEAVQNFMEFTDGISYDYKYPSTVEVAYSYTYIDAKDKFFRRSKLAETPITGEPRYKAALDSVFYTAHEMGNAADAEVWFIDACYLLWRRNEPWHNRPVHTPLKGSVNQVYLINYASQVPVEHGGYLFDSGLPDAQKGTVQLKDTSINGEPDWFVVWTGEKVQDGDVIENDPTGYTPMWGGSTSKGPRYIVNPEKPYDVKAWVDWNTMLQKIKESEDGLIDWSKVPDYLNNFFSAHRGHPTWGAVNADVTFTNGRCQIPQGAPFFGEYLADYPVHPTEPTHGGYKCVPVPESPQRWICNWLVNGKEPVLDAAIRAWEAYATYYYAGQAISLLIIGYCHMYIATKNQMWLFIADSMAVYQPNGDATTEGQDAHKDHYLINPEGVLSNNRHAMSLAYGHQDFVRRNTGLTNTGY